MLSSLPQFVETLSPAEFAAANMVANKLTKTEVSILINAVGKAALINHQLAVKELEDEALEDYNEAFVEDMIDLYEVDVESVLGE
jgi:hypothetical protein